MEKLIACCGLNCAECDARIATIVSQIHRFAPEALQNLRALN
jgi:hypothetical protein